jgi:hypothetical protein
MMHADGYWRDLLAFGWEFKALHGADKIQSWLSEVDHAHTARDFRLEGRPMIGSIGAHSLTLEFFFRFETGIANGRGYARLVAESHAP